MQLLFVFGLILKPQLLIPKLKLKKRIRKIEMHSLECKHTSRQLIIVVIIYGVGRKILTIAVFGSKIIPSKNPGSGS